MTTRHTKTALSDVSGERARQVEKWGDQIANPPGAMLAILTEEIGEVATAVIRLYDHSRPEAHRDVSDLRTELVQVAAVAVQWIEHIDRDREIARGWHA